MKVFFTIVKEKPQVPEMIDAGDLSGYAKRLMDPSDVRVSGSTLYLKSTDVSVALIKAMHRRYPYAAKLYISNHRAYDGSYWFNIPFCGK